MMNKQHGIALVIVLWVVTLLAIMAASFTYAMRTEIRLVTSSSERAQARALAEAGLSYAAFKLLIQPDPEDEWDIEGSVREWDFGQGMVKIAVRDIGGLIDLNQGDRRLLEGLLISAGGLTPDEARALADKIEDYRDPDDAVRIHGAERRDYEALDRNGPKDNFFESIDELQQVLDMTPELYAKIANAITVDSRQRTINPEAASAKVLYALIDIDPALIDQYLADRAHNREQDLPPPPFPAASELVSNRTGIAYHVRVTAVLTASNARDTVEAVISRQRRINEPFYINRWRAGAAVLAQSDGAENNEQETD